LCGHFDQSSTKKEISNFVVLCFVKKYEHFSSIQDGSTTSSAIVIVSDRSFFTTDILCNIVFRMNGYDLD
jgi:hypothetical protein